MTPPKQPLRGRVVLVVGAGDRLAQRASLHLAGRGAAVVAAGPSLDEVIVTAGLVAAAGGTARVIEVPVPPLLGSDLIRRAMEAFEPPTDAVVSCSAFRTAADAWAAAHDLSAHLLPGARVAVLEKVGAKNEEKALERLLSLY